MANPMTCSGPTIARNSFVQPGPEGPPEGEEGQNGTCAELRQWNAPSHTIANRKWPDSAPTLGLCHEGIYLWFGAPKWIRAPNINGETYMKCWEAGHAEKHTICWKACFVVALSCLFFWWKWWNLNAEKQVMLRSTKSAEKHVLLWNVYFLTEMVKLKCWEAGHAEKHKTCWKACFVVKCLFWWKNIK